jgi:hypothetical protein
LYSSTNCIINSTKYTNIDSFAFATKIEAAYYSLPLISNVLVHVPGQTVTAIVTNLIVGGVSKQFTLEPNEVSLISDLRPVFEGIPAVALTRGVTNWPKLEDSKLTSAYAAKVIGRKGEAASIKRHLVLFGLLLLVSVPAIIFLFQKVKNNKQRGQL